MTYEEVKDLKLSEVLANTDLKKLTKQCLSIVDTSTLKDDEIVMLINAAVSDMKRLNIDAENKISDSIIQATIVFFVKANFGMCDIKEKELAAKRYKENCDKLSLSSDYRVKEVDSNA